MSNISTIISESLPDEFGIITVKGYKLNENNQKIYFTKKVKRIYKTIKVFKNANERKNTWKKFGKATEKDNWKCTTISDIDIFMENPMDDELIKENKTNVTYTESKNIEIEKDKDKDSITSISNNKKDYKSSEKYKKDKQQLSKEDTDNTIKILNIHEDIKEYDLFDLFKNFRIKRLSMPKDRTTQSSKGLCFITFYNNTDAENVISKYNNYGYHNTIIKISSI